MKAVKYLIEILISIFKSLVNCEEHPCIVRIIRKVKSKHLVEIIYFGRFFFME